MAQRNEKQAERASDFAVILAHHRTWGAILVPYAFEREPGKKFITVRETLSPYPSNEILGMLTAEEREIVKLINDYSEKHLFRLFSKETNAKKFIETLEKEKLENIIRPYIEAKMHKVLTIIRDEGISLLHQRIKTTNFHPDDQLNVCTGFAEAIFKFSRSDEGTRYSLSVNYDEQEINLYNSGTEVIVNSPCVIRHANRVIFIKSLDSAKLKPFLTREFVSIPASAEEKYFSTFVLNAVTNFRFEASRFEVVTGEPLIKPRLLVESGIRGIPVAILSFNYSGTSFYDNDPRTSFTRFRNENGRFIFTRNFRNKEVEARYRSVLEDHGFFSDDNIHFTTYKGEGSQSDDLLTLIEAVNRSHEELSAAGFDIRQGHLARKYHLGSVDIKTGYTIENDWFDLKAEVTIGEYTIPFVRFRRHILEGTREYQLPDGTVAVLPEAWFTLYRDVFGFSREENDTLKIHKQHFPIVSEALGTDRCEGYSNLERLIMPESLPAVTLPAGLGTEMRPYQAEGFSWMLFLQANKLGGCLADDMGLGKTIQALALLLHNMENYNAEGRGGALSADSSKEGFGSDRAKDPVAENLQGDRETTPGEVGSGSAEDLFSNSLGKLTSLIIVPASLLHNWENEVRLYTPALKVYTYKGIGRRKTNSYFGFYDIILSSYHTVRQDIEIMSGFRFHYVILDESQVIKNPASAVYKAVSKLKSDHKMVLTGTPVENSLIDLWTQMNFVNQGLLGSLFYFKNEFARPIERNQDQRQEEKLKAIIKPFILRRTKDMVAKELPPVWEQMVYCDMTDDQSELYEREKSAIRNSILGTAEGSEGENQAIIVLQGLMRLRQIANHPVLAVDEYEEGSGKFDIVLHDIKSVTAEGHKILIFSSFVKHLNLYAEALGRENIRFSMLTGSTVNREAVVSEFQNDPSRKVFLISLKAGGVGLNLTAADYVFILDPWWNPAAEMQALNRAHRIGQDKNVFVFRYIAAETIEEKIIKLQERKSKIADTFINSNNPLKDLDISQILEIIG